MATSQKAILRRYAIWGGLAFLVVSVAVAALVGWRMRETMLQGTAKMVATGMAGFIGEAYTPEEFAARDATSHARLGAIMAHRAAQGTVYAMRVIAPDGTVVFSSDPAEEGKRAPLNETQIAALEQGEIDSTMTASSGAGVAPLLSVVGPVSMTPDSATFAVVEASREVDPVASGITGAVAAVAATIMVGGIATYLLVFFILKRATDEMASSAKEVHTLSTRLEMSVRDLERTAQELESHSLGTLQSLVAAVDAKDSYTARHSLAVTEYALLIGARLGLDEELALLERAALLHDVGKIGVPEAVLLKPGRLLDWEIGEIRLHSETGAQIIQTIPFLQDIVPVVRHHHERWDGAGYPDGISGPEIPLLSRILTAADALDAMVSARPYRPAQSLKYAREEVERGSGNQFDPVVAAALMDAIDGGDIHPERHHASAGRMKAAS